ncbi:Signal peptide protein [Planctomycetales bacterium 10988]|nr:Signal peptide protein [Planctomycetales bacterium 10988]
MARKYRLLLAVWLWGSLLLVASPAIAAPWNQWFFRQVEADPEKNYALDETNGPWMVMAASFSGDGAEKQAKELVLELRRRYKVSAYTFDRVFDYSQAQNGNRLNRYGEVSKVRYLRGERYQEIAVLVGDFPEVDDPTLQKTLKLVKTSQPDCMELEPGKEDHRSLGAFRYLQEQVRKVTSKEEVLGPLRHAFVVTNPMLPDDYFAPKGLEKFVVDLNKPLEHSLLTCDGKYTLQIATFTGRTLVDPEQIKKVEAGGDMKSELAQAAEKAHKITLELRRKGVEAYEFHDRHQSIVTVGSFKNYGSERTDGKIEINPAIHHLMQEYSAVSFDPSGSNPRMGQPKMVKGIPLDIQPKIVQVPKESISSAYNRRPGFFK